MPLMQELADQNLLDINSLTCCFPNGFEVSDICLSIHKGQRVGLAGESGSGKSFIANMILRLLPSVYIKEGKIEFKGRDLLKLNKKEMTKIRGGEIAYVPQEPLSSLNPLHKVGSQVMESLILHCPHLSKHQMTQSVDEVFESVGLKPKLKNCYPYELSGGQRQRVAIAMGIVNRPKLLICDEPTTALDSTIQKQILELLKTINIQNSIAMLLITHDLNILKDFAHSVYVAKEGKICEKGDVKEVFEKPQDHYTKMLLEALKLPKKSISAKNEKVMEIKNFSITYTKKRLFLKSDSKNIVKNINFELHERETLGIVGESGSGKTSLAMGILKLIKSEGEEYIYNHSVANLSDKAFRSYRTHLQVVFQDPYASLNPRMRVKEIISEAFKLKTTKQPDSIEEILQSVGLDPKLINFYPYELSGGQRQRVAIARAIAIKPKIIVMDEPTSALDKSNQKIILQLLLSLQERFGLSYLFISHDLDVIEAVCDRVMVLKGGSIVEIGNTLDVFTNPQNAYTKELLQARF